MGLLDKLFGGKKGAGESVESALATLTMLYDDPQVKADGGLGVVGRHADEVRSLGHKLAKAGGRERMVEVRDGLRQRLPWAVSNLDAIWASVPAWKG
jgi:hypothetical protein